MSNVEAIAQEHEEWLKSISGLVGETADLVTVERVLDLAKDVAHDKARPLAPIATWALGVAVGRGMDPDEAARAIREAG